MSRPVTIVRSDSDSDRVQMQAPAVNIREDEMDCGIATVACCCGRRARCLQLATPGRFLACVVLLALLLSLLEGFLYSSARLLTNTFDFPPYLFDVLIASSGFFQGVVAVSVAYWGRRIHRPAWLGGLTCLLAAFCAITIIPYAAPSDINRNFTAVSGPRLCERELSQISEPEPELVEGGVGMLIVLVPLLALVGLVNVSFWSHGLTYLDDSVEVDKTPNYIGMLLGLKLTMVKNGHTISEWVMEKPQLWWIPFLLFGILFLAVGVTIVCFPLKMLSTVVKQTAASIVDIASGNSNENLNHNAVASKKEEFWPTIKRVLKNKIIMLDTAALALFATAICNFDTYENAFLQAQYHIPYTHDFVDPWTSKKMGDMFKTVLIILLTMVAGLSFGRLQPSRTKMASFILMMAVHTAMIFVAFVFLDCRTSTIVGEQGSRYLTPLCSHDCKCRSSEVVFEPVCIIEGSQTYFSPCHAGCTTSAQYNNIFVYGNCTCGPNPEYLLGTGPLTSATRGACNANDCFGQWTIFQVFYILNLSLAASTLVAHLLIALRTVRASDKATAVGVLLSGVGLVAYLPGYFLYKLISDKTCLYWNVDGYTCNLHGPKFADILSGVSAGIVVLSCALSVVVWRLCLSYDQEIKEQKIPERTEPLDEVSEDIEEVQPMVTTNERGGDIRPEYRTTRI